MGQIKEYTAENAALHPTQTGVDAFVQAARRIGAFYNQAGEAIKSSAADRAAAATGLANAESTRFSSYGDVAKSIGTATVQAEQYQSYQQISKGGVQLAQSNESMTNAWNSSMKEALARDPNDTTINSKFLEGTFEPWADKFVDGFSAPGARDWAQAQVEHLRKHFYEKTSADMSTLAGEAVKVNQKEMERSWSNTARSDPSAVPDLLTSARQSIVGMISQHPHLTGNDAGKVLTESYDSAEKAIVRAGGFGVIERTGGNQAAVDAYIKRYPKLVDAVEMDQFTKAAQVQAKANLLTQKQFESYQRQQQEHEATAAYSKNFSDNVTIDPTTNRPIINPKFANGTLDIAKKYPGVSSTAARTQLDWLEHQQNLKDEMVRTDPAIKQQFTDRLFSSDNPLTEVDLMRAQVKGLVSKDDFASWDRTIKTLADSPLKGPVWNDTMAAVKSELILSVPGVAGKDEAGIKNYASFAQTFIPQYLAASRAGTLPPNALDIKDPESMISKAMAPFKRTAVDRYADYTRYMGGLGLGGAVPEAGAKPRMFGNVPVPPLLGGIAALQYNSERKQWRDQTSGKIYDAKGIEVAR